MSSTPHPQAGNSAARLHSSAAPATTLTAPASGSILQALTRAFPIPRITTQTWILFGFAAVALLLRLWGLGDRALHHDESLHATYSWYLMGRADPEYHYDPMMHGPLQFHMIAFFYSIFGSSPFTARMWSAACGTALVLVPWLLRKQLGLWVTYALMAILCVSPITLYISRFAREDMQYALFTMLMVAAIVRFVADRQEGRSGYYRWLYVISASFILAYSAKESIYLTVGTLGAFIVGAFAVELLPDLQWPWLTELSARLGLNTVTNGNRWFWLAVPVGWALVLEGIGTVSGSSLHIPMLIPAVLVTLYTGVRLFTAEQGGILTTAVRQVPRATWGLSVAIIVVLFVVLYWPIGDPVSWAFIPGTHTVNTTNTINGVDHPFTYSTDGLIGGLQYWQAQVPVARGGQPWYYYFMLIPLYEWLVVVFGIIGGAWVLLRQRTFATMFVLWWTVSTMAAYAWASEKMPWNALHIVVPLAILAAIGLVRSITVASRFWRYCAIAVAVVTGCFTLHNSYTLAYVNGANPVELMVYVQTNQDVPQVFSEMARIQSHLNSPMHVVVDSADEWPWVFYLRDSNKFFTDKYATTPADYANASQPVLLVDQGNYNKLQTQFAGQYVAFREVLRWWGPEEYKTYAERTYPYTFDAKGSPIPPSGKLLPLSTRIGYFLKDLVSPTSWSNIFQWEINRRPFTPGAWKGDNNQLVFYFLVRKDLVSSLTPDMQTKATQQLHAAELADPFYTRAHQTAPLATIGASSGAAHLSFAGPVAVSPSGSRYVVDVNGAKVDQFSATGALVRSWGTQGSANGQFHFQFQAGATGGQTSGIAVGPSGNVYVSDTWNHRIQEFSSNGAFIRAWGGATPSQDLAHPKPSEFYGPRGLAVAPNGDVYVADTGNRRIQVFNADGKFLFSFGSSGSAVGQFIEPSSVAIDQSGQVYVADYWNRRVQIFSAQGKPLSQFTVSAWQANSYDEPAIAVDTEGHLYLPDPDGGRILVYTTSGQPVSSLGGILNGSQLLTRPLSVAVVPNGEILVSDGGTNQVLLFKAP